MQDNPMAFEGIIDKFLFVSKTTTYFANYFGNNFKTRAILFTICLKELEVNDGNYSDVEKNKINNFIDKLDKSKDEKIIIECIDFFNAKREVV